MTELTGSGVIKVAAECGMEVKNPSWAVRKDHKEVAFVLIS